MAKKYIKGDLEITGTLTNNGQPVGGESVVAYEGTSLLPEGVVFEDWALHRGIKTGNVLWIVITGKIKNTTEASISLTDLFSIVLPEEIASKIYKFDGTTCNSGTTGLILGCYMYWQAFNNISIYLSNTTLNTLTFRTATSKKIPANTSQEVDCRIPLFLDIGSVQ